MDLSGRPIASRARRMRQWEGKRVDVRGDIRGRGTATAAPHSDACVRVAEMHAVRAAAEGDLRLRLRADMACP